MTASTVFLAADMFEMLEKGTTSHLVTEEKRGISLPQKYDPDEFYLFSCTFSASHFL